VNQAEWDARTDTDSEHFDTWGNGDEGTCAVEIARARNHDTLIAASHCL
jgi:hypothetical protein